MLTPVWINNHVQCGTCPSVVWKYYSHPSIVQPLKFGNGCNYLSMLAIKSIHASKRCASYLISHVSTVSANERIWEYVTYVTSSRVYSERSTWAAIPFKKGKQFSWHSWMHASPKPNWATRLIIANITSLVISLYRFTTTIMSSKLCNHSTLITLERNVCISANVIIVFNSP